MICSEENTPVSRANSRSCRWSASVTSSLLNSRIRDELDALADFQRNATNAMLVHYPLAQPTVLTRGERRLAACRGAPAASAPAPRSAAAGRRGSD
eukprot:3140995-Pleurochrysis_carterae.AAC.13